MLNFGLRYSSSLTYDYKQDVFFSVRFFKQFLVILGTVFYFNLLL